MRIVVGASDQMITRVYKMSENSPDTAALSECAKALSAGGLVVFPTETVYGLAANGLDGRACDNVFRVKSRPDEKGLILLLPRDFDVSEIAVVNDAYLTLSSEFYGRPLTYILKKTAKVPSRVSSSETVAFRTPCTPIAMALTELCEFPVTAPSANPSGLAPAKDGETAFGYFNGAVDAIIDAGMTGGGIPTTILDISTDTPRIVREGSVTASEVLECLKEKNIL